MKTKACRSLIVTTKHLRLQTQRQNQGLYLLRDMSWARLFVSALENLGSEVSQEALIQQFQKASVQFDLGGVNLSFGPGDNQGMDKVYLSVLQKNGEFIYVDRLGQQIETAESE